LLTRNAFTLARRASFRLTICRSSFCRPVQLERKPRRGDGPGGRGRPLIDGLSGRHRVKLAEARPFRSGNVLLHDERS